MAILKQSYMDKDIITRLIRELEFIRTRLPENAGLFMGECSIAACGAFLAGFDAACHAVGVMNHPEIMREVARRRGWDGPLAGLSGRMRERGLTEAQAVDELFAIAIAALRDVAGPAA